MSFSDGPENVQIEGPSKINFEQNLTLTTVNSCNDTCQTMNHITERTSSVVHQVTVTGINKVFVAAIHLQKC